MLSVTNKPFMLSVIMLNAIILSVITLNVMAHTSGARLVLFIQNVNDSKKQINKTNLTPHVP